MKIKTITCHDVYNHGASLQAHALQTYLETLGHDVEIIDYKPPYLSKHYDLWIVGNPFYYKYIIFRIIYILLKLPNRLISLKRKRAFDVFAKKYLKISTHRYVSNEELKVNCPEADVFIAGSDQIWNCLFPNGKDPAFYLDFVPKEMVKASYSASFAGSTLDQKYHDMVKTRVAYLDYISVRESSGLDILKKIGINKGHQVLDPVFLLDQDYWNKFATIFYSEDYLFVYDFEGSDQIKEICLKIAKEKHLKIYSINCSRAYVDKKFIYAGPETFVSLIKYSKYVVSNSFHGTAFAILFEKDFYVYKCSININARMEDFLNLYNLNDRFINKIESVETINYSRVKPLLEKDIFRSKEYLRKILA